MNTSDMFVQAITSELFARDLKFVQDEGASLLLPFGDGAVQFVLEVHVGGEEARYLTSSLFRVRSERELAAVCALNFLLVRNGRFGTDPDDGDLHLDGEVRGAASSVVDALESGAALSFFAIEVLNRVRLTNLSIREAIEVAKSERARRGALGEIEHAADVAWQATSAADGDGVSA